MSVVTRPARASDLDDLVAIETDVFLSDRMSRRSFRNLLGRPSALILVAERAGLIAGYAAILFRAANSKARLYSVAVAKGMKGIGRHLLDASERAAAARGSHELRLEVREDNVRAIRLYERNGYREFAREQGYYADGATALHFAKNLADGCEVAPVDGHGTASS